MALTDEERAQARALGVAAGAPAPHLAEQISELLLSTSASGASLEPGGPPSSGDAGVPDGVVAESSEPVRLSTGSPSDRGTPDEGLRSTVATLGRPVPQHVVDRHPSAATQEGGASTPPSRDSAAL